MSQAAHVTTHSRSRAGNGSPNRTASTASAGSRSAFGAGRDATGYIGLWTLRRRMAALARRAPRRSPRGPGGLRRDLRGSRPGGPFAPESACERPSWQLLLLARHAVCPREAALILHHANTDHGLVANGTTALAESAP